MHVRGKIFTDNFLYFPVHTDNKKKNVFIKINIENNILFPLFTNF